MKKKLFLAALCLTYISAQAQTNIEFRYDTSGNRETREISSSESASSSNYLVMKPQIESVTSHIGKQKVKFRLDGSKNLLQVTLPLLGHREAILQITDLQEQQLARLSTTSSKSSISISDYPPGYYRLTIFVGEETKAWEIVRE